MAAPKCPNRFGIIHHEDDRLAIVRPAHGTRHDGHVREPFVSACAIRELLIQSPSSVALRPKDDACPIRRPDWHALSWDGSNVSRERRWASSSADATSIAIPATAGGRL